MVGAAEDGKGPDVEHGLVVEQVVAKEMLNVIEEIHHAPHPILNIRRLVVTEVVIVIVIKAPHVVQGTRKTNVLCAFEKALIHCG